MKNNVKGVLFFRNFMLYDFVTNKNPARFGKIGRGQWSLITKLMELVCHKNPFYATLFFHLRH